MDVPRVLLVRRLPIRDGRVSQQRPATLHSVAEGAVLRTARAQELVAPAAERERLKRVGTVPLRPPLLLLLVGARDAIARGRRDVAYPGPRRHRLRTRTVGRSEVEEEHGDMIAAVALQDVALEVLEKRLQVGVGDVVNRSFHGWDEHVSPPVDGDMVRRRMNIAGASKAPTA